MLPELEAVTLEDLQGKTDDDYHTLRGFLQAHGMFAAYLPRHQFAWGHSVVRDYGRTRNVSRHTVVLSTTAPIKRGWFDIKAEPGRLLFSWWLPSFPDREVAPKTATYTINSSDGQIVNADMIDMDELFNVLERLA